MPQSLGSCLWFLVLSALVAVGCGTEHYLVDRGLDLTDILDFKAGIGLGLGAKIEATDYVGAGLGGGSYQPAVESFGRRFWHYQDDGFLHVILAGADGTAFATVGDETTRNFLLVQLRDVRPPLISRFRFGAEVLVPGLEFGLYVNLGEILDLICGIANFDPALDDGMPKGADLFPEPPPQRPVEPPPAKPPSDPARVEP